MKTIQAPTTSKTMPTAATAAPRARRVDAGTVRPYVDEWSSRRPTCPRVVHTHHDTSAGRNQKATLRPAPGPAGSEPRWLPIDAPQLAQGVTDLAQRSLGPNRIEHGGNHVLRGPGNLHQVADGRTCVGLVTGGSSRGQRSHLFQLDLVADPQDLQLVADRLGVAVDTHHLLLTLLKSDLVGEGRVRNLGHEPAVLDRSEERHVGKECRSRWSPYH